MITMATRGRCETFKVSLSSNKLLSQMTYMAVLFFFWRGGGQSGTRWSNLSYISNNASQYSPSLHSVPTYWISIFDSIYINSKFPIRMPSVLNPSYDDTHDITVTSSGQGLRKLVQSNIEEAPTQPSMAQCGGNNKCIRRCITITIWFDFLTFSQI